LAFAASQRREPLANDVLVAAGSFVPEVAGEGHSVCPLREDGGIGVHDHVCAVVNSEVETCSSELAAASVEICELRPGTARGVLQIQNTPKRRRSRPSTRAAASSVPDFTTTVAAPVGILVGIGDDAGDRRRAAGGTRGRRRRALADPSGWCGGVTIR
jgi:hypothetical protein